MTQTFLGEEERRWATLRLSSCSKSNHPVHQNGHPVLTKAGKGEVDFVMSESLPKMFIVLLLYTEKNSSNTRGERSEMGIFLRWSERRRVKKERELADLKLQIHKIYLETAELERLVGCIHDGAVDSGSEPEQARDNSRLEGIKHNRRVLCELEERRSCLEEQLNREDK